MLESGVDKVKALFRHADSVKGRFGKIMLQRMI